MLVRYEFKVILTRKHGLDVYIGMITKDNRPYKSATFWSDNAARQWLAIERRILDRSNKKCA